MTARTKSRPATRTTVTEKTVTKTTTIDSPVGPLTLAAQDGFLTVLYMHDSQHPPVDMDRWERDDSAFGEATEQLDEYFYGRRTTFDLRLRPTGTEFQQRVWMGLRAIPYGETISYSELAGRIGNPKACRAVGLANGRNPLGIIVPCHRVIGADGTLVGYGGGLDRKRWLLQHEQNHLPR